MLTQALQEGHVAFVVGFLRGVSYKVSDWYPKFTCTKLLIMSSASVSLCVCVLAHVRNCGLKLLSCSYTKLPGDAVVLGVYFGFRVCGLRQADEHRGRERQ